MIIMSINQYWIIGLLSRGTETPSRLLPLIRDFAKRQFSFKVPKLRKLKNLGKAPVVPDVDDIILRKFARVLLQEIGRSAGIEDVKLTEPVWLVGGKFKDVIGGSPAQFKACMERLEQERIVTRAGGKNVRVWAMPYRSITSKLQRLLK
jgi:hypothetical protein